MFIFYDGRAENRFTRRVLCALVAYELTDPTIQVSGFVYIFSKSCWNDSSPSRQV